MPNRLINGNDAQMIPVSQPDLGGNERRYVLDCLDSGWISSAGGYVDAFETAFANFCGTRHAIACTNGTVALHLALLAAGVGPGDEVIVPTLTYVATANAVRYCGARPVFVDSEPLTWNLDPASVEARISDRTKAILPVHLYGHPCDIGAILDIAAGRRIAVIEDAAEAHGAEYRSRRVGTFGTAATFSFYGNKLLTCGEGGMVVTDDDELALVIRRLKGQGVDPDRRFWHPVIGYNYRMTNIAAAIGLAQLERVAEFVDRRRAIAGEYRRILEPAGFSMQGEADWAKHVYWLPTVLIEGGLSERDEVMAGMAEAGIETRPVFYPMHVLPPHRDPEFYRPDEFPVATDVSTRGINLPSFNGLTSAQVELICDEFIRVAGRGPRPSNTPPAARLVGNTRSTPESRS